MDMSASLTNLEHTHTSLLILFMVPSSKRGSNLKKMKAGTDHVIN